MTCSTPPARWRAEPALAAPLRSASAPPPEKPARDFWNEPVANLLAPLAGRGTDPRQREAEGQPRITARRAYVSQSVPGAGGVRQAGCAHRAARRTRHLSAALSE